MSSVDCLPEPYRLVHLDEVGSTNAEAMRLAAAGETGPLWIIADRQTAGRGRSGRVWESVAGNLFASLLIATSCPPAKAGQLSLVAGVAAFDAIADAGPLTTGAALRLKWPNDILIGCAKAGGILIESTARPGGGMTAVIGIGLNLAAPPPALGAAATALALHGLSLSPREALCFLGASMDGWLRTWNDGEGFAPVRDAWLARAGAPGERITVNAGGRPVEGRFVGLDADGALIVEDEDGRQRRFSHGDVTLAASPAAGRPEEKDDSQ